MPNVPASYGTPFEFIALCLTCQVNICSHFLQLPRKGKLKWTIYKHEPDKNKKCPSVVVCRLSPIVCSASSAYTGLCRGLKYLLNVRYIRKTSWRTNLRY